MAEEDGLCSKRNRAVSQPAMHEKLASSPGAQVESFVGTLLYRTTLNNDK